MVAYQPMDTIRVFICDDYYVIREGLRAILARDPDLEIVGEAENGAEAVERVAHLLPDIVIMDIAMPGMDGIQATRLIKQANPSVGVIAFTRYDDPDHILEIYRSGASGYLVKSARADEILSTIHAVHEGGVLLHPQVAGDVIRAFAGASVSAAPPLAEHTAGLTSRELEVLRLIGQGLTNKEIAQRLDVSVRTVQNHAANIIRKLHLNDRIAAAIYAINRGLTAGAASAPAADRAARPGAGRSAPTG